MRQMFFRISILILFVVVVLFACKKSLSIETGKGVGGNAIGTLLDSLGNCQQMIVHGNYVVDSLLTDSNYVFIKVTTSLPGKCKINSDTVNGMWFNDSAYAFSTGVQTIKVKGYGKPILPIATTFNIAFDSTYCQFSPTVLGVPPLRTNTDYFPTTINSNWTYLDHGVNDTVRTTVSSSYLTDPTTGYSYSLFSSVSSTYSKQSFYRKDGNGSYYQYAPIVDSSNAIDFLILKDNVGVGMVWESPEMATQKVGVAKAKIHFTMRAVDTTYTLNATVVPHVIKVQEDHMYFIQGVYQTLRTDYAYYAKNIGLLATDYLLVPQNNFDIQRYLIY